MQNSGELIEAFREDIVDTAKPYLWTDAEVIRYADAAYRQFIRLIGGIADITSDATVIDITLGENLATVHPSVLRIMSATLRSDSSNLRIVNGVEGTVVDKDYGLVVRSWRKKLEGPVTTLIHGMERGKVALLNCPVADDTIDMHIYRTALVRIVDEGHPLDEVDMDHRIYLLDWMKHLAYKKQDSETFDKSKSDECEDNFRKYCAQVKAEHERYKHKTRVVQYAD